MHLAGEAALGSNAQIGQLWAALGRLGSFGHLWADMKSAALGSIGLIGKRHNWAAVAIASGSNMCALLLCCLDTLLYNTLVPLFL